MKAFNLKNLSLNIRSLNYRSLNYRSPKKVFGVGYNEYLIILSLLSVFSIAAFKNYSQVIQHQTAGIAAEVAGTHSNAESAQTSSNNKNQTQSTQPHQRIIMPEGFVQTPTRESSSTQGLSSTASNEGGAADEAVYEEHDDQDLTTDQAQDNSQGTSTAPEQQTILQRILANLDQFTDGLIEGVKTQGEGMLEMILHPIETAKAIASLVEMLIDDPAAVAQAMLDEFSGQLEGIKNGDVETIGQFIGENVSPAAILSVVKKGVAIGKVAGKVGSNGPNGKKKGSSNSDSNSNNDSNTEETNSCCCFAKGTLVATDKGSKAIETLQRGDIVHSLNQTTGQTELQPVTHTFITKGKTLYELTTIAQGIGNGEIRETVEVTDNHPYWVINQGWTDSIQLTAGDQLLQKSGDIAEVISIVNLRFTQTTYNLEVANNHNYFVGESQILVHNDSPNCSCTVGSDSGEGGDKDSNKDGDETPHVPNSPVEYDHVLKGDFNKGGTGKRATGGHSMHNDNVRIVEGTKGLPDANKVYEAKIEVWHPEREEWIQKKGDSHTMFPDDWSVDKIKKEIDTAWNNPKKIIDSRGEWSALSESGVLIKGYIGPRVTAYPVMQ